MSYGVIAPFASGDINISAKLDQYRDNLNSLRYGNDQLVALYLSDDQSIPTSTNTFIDWDTVIGTQVGSIWSGGNPSRLYNNSGVDAVWTAVLNVEWLTSTTGERSTGFRRNGDGMLFHLPSNGANQGGGNQSGMLEISVDDGDYIEAFVWHTNGSSISIHGKAKDRTSVWMAMTGAL